MGHKALGVDWTCDICGKAAHTGPSEWKPNGWSQVLIKGIAGVGGEENLYACESCWTYGPTKPEAKKTILQNFLNRIRAKG